MKTLIKNGIIVTTENEYKGDILLEGTKIEAVGRHLAVEADEVIDAEGMYKVLKRQMQQLSEAGRRSLSS